MSKFARVSVRLFIAWNVHTVVFLPIFSGYFCIGDYVACIVSDGCNQSSSALVYVVFESLYRCHCIDASAPSWILASLLHPFLLTHIVYMSSLECKALSMVINFLVLWFTCFGFYFIYLKISPEEHTKGTAQVFTLWWDSCYIIWSRVVFSFTRYTLFLFHLHWFDVVQYSQVFVTFFSSNIFLIS